MIFISQDNTEDESSVHGLGGAYDDHLKTVFPHPDRILIIHLHYSVYMYSFEGNNGLLKWAAADL